MALTATTREQLSRLEDDLAEVASKLRKMRQEWAESNAGELPLEVDKAIGFVEYLRVTWIHRCYAQFQSALAKVSHSTQHAGKK